MRLFWDIVGLFGVVVVIVALFFLLERLAYGGCEDFPPAPYVHPDGVLGELLARRIAPVPDQNGDGVIDVADLVRALNYMNECGGA